MVHKKNRGNTEDRESLEGGCLDTDHLHLQAQMLSINDLKINIFLTTQKLTKKHSDVVVSTHCLTTRTSWV